MPTVPEEPAAAGRWTDVMVPAAHQVESVVRETKDTFTLGLKPEDGGIRAGFAPGQFSMLYVFGVGELPISISGDPEEPRRLVYTVRSVGPATKALVSSQPGDTVGVRGPFGTSWPLEAARGRDVLIVAGGIGLAPLRPVIYHVLRHRDDYVRLIVLYGARSPGDRLFRKELEAWNRLPDTHVLSTVDYGGATWRGRVGVVTTLFRYVRLHPDRTVAMICGPEIMMRYVIGELENNRGVPASNIYLSMERNMKCAVGFCGHCQFGPHFICKDGPVFPYDRLRNLMGQHEL
ncbi:MAG: FAD/NAD(P)-binding protein [Bryobacterales bacterium]|nr:FAD/NAD(P)-binding protein [Bryobacterales bacterium]